MNTIERSAISRPLVLTGLLPALAAVFLWGSNAVIARHLALEGVSMSVVAFLRVAIGGAALTLWLAAGDSGVVKRVNCLVCDRWAWAALACYGGNMLVFHWALARTSASAVMLLENIAPVVALFGGAWLFSERITRRALAALALALGGVLLVCLANPGLADAARSASALGNGLALLAGLTWGGYTLACQGHGRQRRTTHDALSAMAFMLVGSAVVLAPAALLTDTGWPVTAPAWGWVLALGVLHTALATVLWRMALNHLSSYSASLLFLLTIVLTMVNGGIFLGERPTLLMVLGACCIIGALLIRQKRRPPVA